MPEGLSRIEVVAQRNSVSRATIYREIAAGRLAVVKIGTATRITPAAERAWIASLPVKGIIAA